jgi:hypothetical protein
MHGSHLEQRSKALAPASTSNSHLEMLWGLCFAMGLKGRYVCTPFEMINEFEINLGRIYAH